MKLGVLGSLPPPPACSGGGEVGAGWEGTGERDVAALRGHDCSCLCWIDTKLVVEAAVTRLQPGPKRELVAVEADNDAWWRNGDLARPAGLGAILKPLGENELMHAGFFFYVALFFKWSVL